jgi:hypothetical protein
MRARVFAQTARLDLAALVRSTQKFFEATVEVLEERGLAVPAPDARTLEPFARLRISSARRRYSGVFRVTCRTALAEDWVAAQAAEARGRATGMGALARRCVTVWEVEGDEESAPEAALLSLCAVLASVALGPVLPADESTLFGVRGAMERLEALTGRSLSR